MIPLRTVTRWLRRSNRLDEGIGRYFGISRRDEGVDPSGFSRLHVQISTEVR